MEELTEVQLSHILWPYKPIPIRPGVYRVVFRNGWFGHLTANTFVIGKRPFYPDTEGFLRYIGNPSCLDQFPDRALTYRNAADFAESVSSFLGLYRDPLAHLVKRNDRWSIK